MKAVIIGAILLFSNSVHSRIRMFEDVQEFGDVFGVSEVQVDQLWAFLIQSFEDNGLPVVVDDLKLVDALALVKHSKGDFNNRFLDSQRSKLQSRIDYWLSQIGKEALINFISGTEHTNPYHLFLIDLESFSAYLKLLKVVGFIGDIDSPTGLDMILRYHYWGEGVGASKSIEASDWKRWEDLLSAHLPTSAVSNFYNEAYFRSELGRDFFQGLYLKLSVKLLNVLELFPEFVSQDLLSELVLVHDEKLSVYSEYIRQIFIILKGRDLKTSDPKRVAKNALIQLSEYKADDLDKINTLKVIVDKALDLEQNSCSGVLSK